MTGTVKVRHNLIQVSFCVAVRFFGQPVTSVTFDRNIIGRAGTFALQLKTSGSATFCQTVAAGLGAGGVHDCYFGITLIERRGKPGML